MKIDRFPLWVACSLIGVSRLLADEGAAVKEGNRLEFVEPNDVEGSHALREYAPERATQDAGRATQDGSKQEQGAREEVAAPRGNKAFGWAKERDLPIFDFERVDSVLKDLSQAAGASTAGESGKYEMQTDRELQHYAKLFRIWAFEAYRHDSEEYRRRVATLGHVMKAWEMEGGRPSERRALKNWMHQAAVASVDGKPMPTPEFVDAELVAKIAQGLDFARSGGPLAGTAFVRAMANGSTYWLAPRGFVGLALRMPLPFDLPEPESLVNAGAKQRQENIATDSIPDLDIAPEMDEVAETPEPTPADPPAEGPATEVFEPEQSVLPTLSP